MCVPGLGLEAEFLFFCFFRRGNFEQTGLMISEYFIDNDIIGEGNGNPLQYSCLGNPMDKGAWWATVHGVTKSQTELRD